MLNTDLQPAVEAVSFWITVQAWLDVAVFVSAWIALIAMTGAFFWFAGSLYRRPRP